MEKEMTTVGKSKKNPTTNYPKDSHNAFCKRCFKYHGRCPAKDPDACNL